MNDLYHPQTLEHIRATKKATWMLEAGAPAPEYDPQGSAAFFVDGAWEVRIFQRDPDEIRAEVEDKTQQRLDDFAKERNYSGIMSACTYATSTNERFRAEGQYCVEARDATWAKLYEILAEVMAGNRPVPDGYADIEPELPELSWPVI